MKADTDTDFRGAAAAPPTGARPSPNAMAAGRAARRTAPGRLALLAPLALLATALLGGCAQNPRLDRQFGSSLRLAVAQQTLNPQARYNRGPVNGLDAQAAKSAYDSYQRAYAAPEQQQNSGLTLGGGAGTR